MHLVYAADAMNEEDKKTFLDDFKKADKTKKLDMWYHAVEQQGLWEELIAEMADIAQAQNIGQKMIKEE